jgi:hypothetical protein
VLSSIVRMLNVVQMFIPKLRMLTAISTKKMYHCMIQHLCLTICLRMKSCALFQLGVHECPQNRLKTSNKSRFPIINNGLGKTKMHPNILKEQLCHLFYCYLLITRHQYTHPTKTINHNIKIIMTSS